MMKDMTRRDFFKTSAAVGAAATAAAAVPALADEAPAAAQYSFEIAPEPITDIAETIEADLVVVGAGTSGLVTALAALEEGLSVTVVTASSKPISRGGSNHATYSKAMEALGLEPEPISCIKREIYGNWGHVDPGKWYRAYSGSEEAMNWLIDIMAEAGYSAEIEEGMKIPRGDICYQHLCAHGFIKDRDADQVGMTQPYVVNTLADKFVAEGGAIYFNNIGRQLVRGGVANGTEGRVDAVIAEREDGTFAKYVGTKGVVLATGDFSTDREMMQKYAPHVLHCVSDELYDSDPDYDVEFMFGGLYKGDGQKMGLWVGAGWQKTYPNCPMGGTGINAGPSCQPYGNFYGLLLNRDGDRFVNEYCGSVTGGGAAIVQPGSTVYAIWDSAYAQHPDFNGAQGGVGILQALPPEEIIASWDASVDAGTYVKADTIEELVAALGLPESAIAEIERYNGFCETGVDEEFFKDPSELYPVATPPFYGQKSDAGRMGILTVLGGLDTDKYMRILDTKGDVIPGLYNVGTMIGDFFAGTYTFIEMGVNYGYCCVSLGYQTGKYIAANE